MVYCFDINQDHWFTTLKHFRFCQFGTYYSLKHPVMICGLFEVVWCLHPKHVGSSGIHHLLLYFLSHLLKFDCQRVCFNNMKIFKADKIFCYWEKLFLLSLGGPFKFFIGWRIEIKICKFTMLKRSTFTLHRHSENLVEKIMIFLFK